MKSSSIEVIESTATFLRPIEAEGLVVELVRCKDCKFWDCDTHDQQWGFCYGMSEFIDLGKNCGSAWQEMSTRADFACIAGKKRQK